MTFHRIEHGYDRASNRLYRKQAVQASGHDELYSYLHRLVDAERGTLNAGRDAINGLNFARDGGGHPLGDWQTFDQDDDGGGWDLQQTRTHSDANEIETISTRPDRHTTRRLCPLGRSQPSGGRRSDERQVLLKSVFWSTQQ